MSNKNVLTSVLRIFFLPFATRGGWCYTTLGSIFSPGAHDSFPPNPSQPRLFMPHYVLPQFPFSVPLWPSLSVHMILVQLPATRTWKLSLMILLFFLFSIPAILYICIYFLESSLFHFSLNVWHAIVAICRNIQKLWILPIECISVFHVILKINNNKCVCFPPRRPRFKPGSGHVGFLWWTKVALGQVFSPRTSVAPANLHSI
jgi:hypothetical protein